MTASTDQRSPLLYKTERVFDILVPISASDVGGRGPAIAGRYAASWGVPVRLLHVKGELEDAQLEMLSSATWSLGAAHPELVVDGVEVEGEDVASGILNAATDRSLVFLASDHGSQWLDEGSIGEAVVQKSSGPVVLCGPNCQSPPVGSSVVVPLDGSTRAEAALAPALAVAEASGARLWLVTVVSQSTVEAVASMRERGERVSESGYLRGVADDLSSHHHDVGWEVIHSDDPVDGVVSFVRHRGSSMIVSATRGDTGIAKRLFGSVSFGLVERGPVPVMVIRPDVSDAIPLLAAEEAE